jgi:hypothetical protein
LGTDSLSACWWPLSGVAGFGAFSNSYGQSSETAEPRITYGGVRDFEWVWLRLDESRHVALALEVPWAASGKRCSDYLETQTVKATLTDERVTGTIAGKAKRTKPNGQVVRCTFGPLRWSAVD